jgi:hypothetical protein
MAEYLIQDTTLTDIADAIREKLEITDTMTPEQMPEYIRSIETAQYYALKISHDKLTSVYLNGTQVSSGAYAINKGESVTIRAMYSSDSDLHQMDDVKVQAEGSDSVERYPYDPCEFTLIMDNSYIVTVSASPTGRA